MNDPMTTDTVALLEQRIQSLTAKLQEAKEAVQSWTDANASLSQSAAEARAKNQGAGRGFIGGLLGAKYRSAVRAGAAASNAAIAKDVAEKRGRIADGKRAAQDAVRAIQQALSEAKAELKDLTTAKKGKASAVKSAGASLDLLQKLKQARDDGLLTAEEYEQKRKRLVSDL